MHIKLLFFKVCSNVRYINRYVSVFRWYYPPLKQSGSDQESQPISFWIFIVPLLKNILFIVINIDVNCLLSFQVYVMILLMPSVLSVSLGWSWQKRFDLRCRDERVIKVWEKCRPNGWTSWQTVGAQTLVRVFVLSSWDLQFLSQPEVIIPYHTSLNWRLQYLTIPLSTNSYNTLQYLTQLEVSTIPLPTQ